MKIADGVEALEINVNHLGKQTKLCPTLFWDETTAVLVDAGYPGFQKQIKYKIEKAGIPFDRLNKIILTHQDFDHTGGLPDLLAISQQKIAVMAHELDKPYIQGEMPLLKTSLKNIPELYHKLSAPPMTYEYKVDVPVDVTVADGEELPYCGGILVIHMPGHTPGHICLYHKKSKTFVAGDALVFINGKLSKTLDSLTQDITKANKSLEKLVDYDIKTLICYHEGVCKDNVRQRLLEILNIK